MLVQLIGYMKEDIQWTNHGTLIQGKVLHFIQYVWKTLESFSPSSEPWIFPAGEGDSSTQSLFWSSE